MATNPGPNGAMFTVDRLVRRFLEAGDTDLDTVREYVAHLLGVCESQARAVHSQLRLALLATGAFLVFSRREVDAVSIAGVTVSNLALLHAALPLVVLAMVLRAVLTLRDREINVHIYQKLIQYHRPGLFQSGLHDQLVPLVMPLARSTGVARGTSYGRFFHQVGRGERYALLAVGPLAFTVYAYVVLFATYSVTNAAVWLSLSIAIGLAALLGRALYGPQIFGGSPWPRPDENEEPAHDNPAPSDPPV
ncbi:hypothetical protein [Dactylosporangium sp. NPDC000521]|uniref:hypothetical protein n=1 Tax=Dactylosporangium sp. NPDC000521 TaxID=3363975 RepID=UPI0036769D1C